jgi:hypothetical protein
MSGSGQMMSEVSDHLECVLWSKYASDFLSSIRDDPHTEICTKQFPLPLMEQKVMTKSLTQEQLGTAVQKSSEPTSELMTEAEVIHFLRIPEISDSKNYHNVIEHLKRNRNLPRIHICRKALYPKKAILAWVEKETDAGK